MDDEPTTLPVMRDATEEPSEAVISVRTALRVVLVLLAVWTFFSGLALAVFQGGAEATIGGGEGAAAQRLLGIHLLVLAPIYGLLAWEPQRYRMLLWMPYATQAGIVIVTVFDLLTDNRDIEDGILPLIITATFFVLLLGVWWAARRPQAAPSEVVEARAVPLQEDEKETADESEESDET